MKTSHSRETDNLTTRPVLSADVLLLSSKTAPDRLPAAGARSLYERIDNHCILW